MTSEIKQSRHKGGRPKKAIRKDMITGVRFLKAEYFVVRHKAQKAGLGITIYIRQMALHGEVRARMNDEERQFVRQLIGMSNNLNQLAKCCHQEGALTAILHFEKYRKALDELLEKLRK